MPIPPNISSDPINTFNIIFLIHQLAIMLKLAQIGSILLPDLILQLVNAFANLYIQIMSIKVLNKILRITIVT